MIPTLQSIDPQDIKDYVVDVEAELRAMGDGTRTIASLTWLVDPTTELAAVAIANTSYRASVKLTGALAVLGKRYLVTARIIPTGTPALSIDASFYVWCETR